MTALTPEQMRGEASWLDGYAEGIEGTSEDGATEPLRTAAITLRAAADRIEVVGEACAADCKPVSTDELRHLAEWLVSVNVTHSPRLGVGYISKMADELDRLRATISSAPHETKCPCSLHARPQLPFSYANCTCWKADAL